MLKKGCVATKYSRSGKARKTTFQLSADEATLSWDAGLYGLAAPVKIVKGERRNVKFHEVRGASHSSPFPEGMAATSLALPRWRVHARTPL